MRAVCQVCKEIYADVYIDALRYPLTGGMFSSPDAAHGYPDPFDHTLTWEFLRCPYGRIHRPMVQDDIVLTDEGVVRLPKDGSKAFMDASVSGEVDRNSISDRAMQVPDDVAERMARAAIGKGQPTIADETRENDPKHEPETKSVGNEVSLGYRCSVCNKQFDTKKQLNGHMGGAHKSQRKRK